MKKMSTHEILQHLPARLTDDEFKWIEDVALLHSRYLFYWTDKQKKRHGFCSLCHTDSIVSKEFEHGDEISCPACGGKLHAFRACRKLPRDRVYVTIARKSPINPDVLVFMGIYARRDYQESFKTTVTWTQLYTLNVFEMGRSSGTLSDFFGSHDHFKTENNPWHMLKTYSREGAFYEAKPVLNIDSIAEAISGTSFRYMPWRGFVYLGADIVRFFSLAAKYPAIEYLVKLGFGSLVRDAMYGGNNGAIYLAGKTIDEVLGVPRHSVKELRKTFHDHQMDSVSFWIWKLSKACNMPVSEEVIRKVCSMYWNNRAAFKAIIKHVYLSRFLSYVEKQTTHMPAHMRHHSQIISHWRDYLDACKKLNLDMKAESTLFPPNLSKAHDRAIERVRYVEDKALNDKIEARLPSLDKKYRFETELFLIRPAVSTVELIREGAALHHCVGGYAKRYAAGETVILMIRTQAEPDKPFFTVEVRENRMVQCMGSGHKCATPSVWAFVEEWKASRLKNTKKHEQSQIMVAV